MSLPQSHFFCADKAFKGDTDINVYIFTCMHFSDNLIQIQHIFALIVELDRVTGLRNNYPMLN